MEAKLNFDKIRVSKEGTMSLTYFAFLKVHQQLSIDGIEVSDLKITHDGEIKVSEVGFRDFLRRIASMQYKGLTEEEQGTVSKIVQYLATPVEGEPEPINSGNDKSISQVIDEKMTVEEEVKESKKP